MGKKNETSFKKGQSGNPKGRPLVPPDLKAARAMNQIELERILNHVMFLNTVELTALTKAKDVPAIIVGASKIMQKVVKSGDLWAASFIMDRVVGRPFNASAPAPQPTRDVVGIGSGLKTFAEFCAASGYFIPFPKQEEMRAFGFDIEATRLLLGARGYGKTDFVTIMGTAYDLYKASKSGMDLDLFTNLIITKSKARNGAIVEEISKALEKNGVEMDTSNKSVIRLKGLIGQDHSVEAITIKSSMRGRHPKRIIMDDPVTDEDTSAKMRETVEKRYNEAYKLCSNIVIIGQPAHFDDLFAKLRNIIETMLVPHGSIPELDADLAAMEAAGIDKTSIEMSYHLRVPKTGAAIFGELKYLEEPFGPGPSVAFMDPSDGGDYTALTIGRGKMEALAVKGHAWKKAYYHCYDELVATLKAHGVLRLVFETNKHGEGPLIQLNELLGPHGIGVVGFNSTGDKHGRIEQAGSYAHMIHLSKESDKIYTDQVTKYEYGAKFDDAPDSLSGLLIWLGLLKKKR